MTTVCGHMKLLRKRWKSAIGVGCQVPLDGWLGIADEVVTMGVMALVCLLNRGTTSFEHAAERLQAATNIRLGKETLRKLCLESGQAMQQAIAKGELVPEWTAKDCVLPVAPTEKELSHVSELIEEAISRISLGCDGVLVPLITQAEKRLRRDKVLTRRRVLRTAGHGRVRNLVSGTRMGYFPDFPVYGD